MEANQVAEALKIEADAEALALQVKVGAETKAELMQAEAEANASEKRAQAAKIRAEATRAETAAPGLAEAEVEAARVEVAEKQVTVTRADGLAKAEVAQAQAEAEAERLQRLKEVEINAQKQLVALYDKAPVLVEIEKLRMEYEHQERLVNLQMDAYLKAMESIAPGVKVQIYGSGNQTSQIFTELMSFSHGINLLGEEVPLVGQILHGGDGTGQNQRLSVFHQFFPYIQQVLAEVNPRLFSSLKVVDLVERLDPVIAGQEELSTALNNIKEDASFRMVGDLPLKPFLQFFGVLKNSDTDVDDAVLTMDEEPEKEEDILPLE
jgi:hypothetical protein